jgi:diaminopropionate ammonia-lyase
MRTGGAQWTVLILDDGEMSHVNSEFSYTHSNYVVNTSRDPSAHDDFVDFLSDDACQIAFSTISQWDDYKATDLVALTDVAARANVAQVWFKDESSRFGLGSFKALGGAYAVSRLATDYEHSRGSLDGFSVATATDGNHGRSVAWGAQRLGLECHIFIHAHVSQVRADAMAALGAHIHRVDGNYDDSLVACEQMAAESDWQIVSDTSWEGYESVPLDVMAGYTVMAREIVAQLNGVVPTHCFIPAGCGGLAGAMLTYFWHTWGEQLPRIVVVESAMSDCVFQSISNQNLTMMHIVDETVMAGLSCGEVSRVVWPVLAKGVSHVVTIPDAGVRPMMRWLAHPADARRPSIEGGECSAASAIALMAGCADHALGQSLELDGNSTVLLLGTEGATDPEFYAQAMAGADGKQN